MAATDRALLEAVRDGLRRLGDPVKAPRMQSYMKSTMPYYGVRMPDVRAICKRAFAEHPPASCDEWQAAVLELWRKAKYREERYAAIELMAGREIKRNFTETQGDSRRATEVPAACPPRCRLDGASAASHTLFCALPND